MANAGPLFQPVAQGDTAVFRVCAISADRNQAPDLHPKTIAAIAANSRMGIRTPWIMGETTGFTTSFGVAGTTGYNGFATFYLDPSSEGAYLTGDVYVVATDRHQAIINFPEWMYDAIVAEYEDWRHPAPPTEPTEEKEPEAD